MAEQEVTTTGRYVLGPLLCIDCGYPVAVIRTPFGHHTVDVRPGMALDRYPRHLCPTWKLSAPVRRVSQLDGGRIRVIASVR